jgi:hypothetical protein
MPSRSTSKTLEKLLSNETTARPVETVEEFKLRIAAIIRAIPGQTPLLRRARPTVAENPAFSLGTARSESQFRSVLLLV